MKEEESYFDKGSYEINSKQRYPLEDKQNNDYDFNFHRFDKNAYDDKNEEEEEFESQIPDFVEEEDDHLH
jgi:hypothetical protein